MPIDVSDTRKLLKKIIEACKAATGKPPPSKQLCDEGPRLGGDQPIVAEHKHDT